jgi:integrase
VGTKKQRVATGVYKLEPGLYEIAVSSGRGPDGKYGQVFRRFRGTFAGAKTERARMLAEVADGSLKPAESLTMSELHARFMATKVMAQTTRDQYEYLWQKLKPFVGATSLRKLRTVDLDHAYAQIVKDVSPNVVRKVHKHVTALLNKAIAWDLIGKNVASAATPPDEVPFNVTPPTSDQRVALVDAAFEREPQFGALVYLAAVTGARRGELGGLRWCDIDLKNGTVRFKNQPPKTPEAKLRPTKTKLQRTIPIDADTVTMLKAHLAHCENIARACSATITDECFVFSPTAGNRQPYRLDGLTYRFAKLAKATGIKNRLHDVRHAQATTLLAQGISPVVVAERLGMTVEVLLSTYGHSDAEQEQRAAAAGALRP